MPGISSSARLFMIFYLILLHVAHLICQPEDPARNHGIPMEIPGLNELESNLPIVVINTFGVPIPDEPKITAHMGIIDNGPGALNSPDDPFNDYDGAIGIETRGSSTQMFPKKSYAVETRDAAGEDLDASLLGLPEESDWVLYAPYTDKSMLRNMVSFEIGRRMGHYCTRTIYCELVLNDVYEGVYILMEKIKKDEHRVDIASLNPDELSGDDLTGGYIIKVDKIDWDFIYGVDGWKSNPSPPYPNAMDITFQYYYPEADEMASLQKMYIRDFVTSAENTLTSYFFDNPYIGYQKYLDVPSFIDFMLLCEVSKEVDKYRYSTYFYKEKDSDGGKLFAGPAWDFNLGYGNVDYWPPGIDYTGWVYPLVQPHDASLIFWWKRLMEDPYFCNMAKGRWEYLRQDKLSDTEIDAFIDSVLLLVDDAKDRNYEKWPILGQYVWPNYNWEGNDYEDEVAYFETFLYSRLHWMDANFTGAFTQPSAGITPIGEELILKVYNDYFERNILKTEDFRLNDAPAGTQILDVIFVDAATCRLILSADVSAYPGVSVTVDEKAVNYWEDITSASLSASGLTGPPDAASMIDVFEAGGQIQIRCKAPEILQDGAVVLNLAGQQAAGFSLNRGSSQHYHHSLTPGLYLLRIETTFGPVVKRFVVSR